MTLDHQIINPTLKWSQPAVPSGGPLVQHAHTTLDSDAGLTENPLTKLLAIGKEDDNAQWHVCLMAGYKNISSVFEKNSIKVIEVNIFTVNIPIANVTKEMCF